LPVAVLVRRRKEGKDVQGTRTEKESGRETRQKCWVGHGEDHLREERGRKRDSGLARDLDAAVILYGESGKGNVQRVGQVWGTKKKKIWTSSWLD